MRGGVFSDVTDLVSIIMAAHNEERFIGEAIDSVLAQEYPRWELLVVDDGSSDGTRAVVECYSDTRIRYFEQERRGTSAARNRGLKEMSGKYFCFLDADDALTSSSLSARVALFERAPDTRFVNGPIVEKDENLNATLRVHIPAMDGEPLEYLLKLDPRCVSGSTWMFRSPVRSRGFKEGLANGEDLLFCIEESAQGGVLRSVDETVLLYRSGRRSTASGNISGVERAYRIIARELRDIANVGRDDVRRFKKISKRIMLRSYLAQRKPFSAIRTLFTW